MAVSIDGFTSSDIDQMIKHFRNVPTKDEYDTIQEWYLKASVHPKIDDEYLLCIYLFLQGANIKNRYYPITVDEHRVLVSELRDYIERADPLYKNRRKTYLDYGSKAGYYK